MGGGYTDTIKESGTIGRVDGPLRSGPIPPRPVAAVPTVSPPPHLHRAHVAVILPPIFITCDPNLVLMSYVSLLEKIRE